MVLGDEQINDRMEKARREARGAQEGTKRRAVDGRLSSRRALARCTMTGVRGEG